MCKGQRAGGSRRLMQLSGRRLVARESALGTLAALQTRAGRGMQPAGTSLTAQLYKHAASRWCSRARLHRTQPPAAAAAPRRSGAPAPGEQTQELQGEWGGERGMHPCGISRYIPLPDCVRFCHRAQPGSANSTFACLLPVPRQASVLAMPWPPPLRAFLSRHANHPLLNPTQLSNSHVECQARARGAARH